MTGYTRDNSDIPFILAGDEGNAEFILDHIGKQIDEVRFVWRESDLNGHYNGILYVGRGVPRKLIRVAERRGFQIVYADV